MSTCSIAPSQSSALDRHASQQPFATHSTPGMRRGETRSVSAQPPSMSTLSWEASRSWWPTTTCSPWNMADNSPAPFESLVKKIHKCIFHVLAHISSHVHPGPEAARVLEHTLSTSSSSSGSATCLAAKRPRSPTASLKCKRDGGASTGARARTAAGEGKESPGACVQTQRGAACAYVSA